MGGSYGANEWVTNPFTPNVIASGRYDDAQKAKFWPRTTMAKGYEVPVFMGARWLGSSVNHTDVAPQDEEDIYLDSYGKSNIANDMRRFMINRHGGAVNAAFMDASARKISLKALWTLNWHRQFINAYPSKNSWISKSSNWPDWMIKFSDEGLK